jgi:hypothetical protein
LLEEEQEKIYQNFWAKLVNLFPGFSIYT